MEANTKPLFEFSSFQQWEIAFIYAFACTFNSHHDIAPTFYPLPAFTPQELEDEIQKEESDLIHRIICACVGNTLNRSKPIEGFKISLQQLITDKMKTFEIDLETNPLSKQNFNALPVDSKLYILYSLIEWQLQDSHAVKSIIEYANHHCGRNETSSIVTEPIGADSKKRKYWQFGDSGWIWREKMHLNPVCEWETVCKTRQDQETLVASLSTTNKAEKALAKVIVEQLYDIADKEEQKRVRKERAELRKLLPPPPVSITPTTLRSRGNRAERVRYNYDDIYGIDEDDKDYSDSEDDENSDPSNRRSKRKRASASPVNRPPPTRWSSRLNRHDGDDNRWSDLEQMNLDSQPTESESTAMSITSTVDEEEKDEEEADEDII